MGGQEVAVSLRSRTRSDRDRNSSSDSELEENETFLGFRQDLRTGECVGESDLFSTFLE